MQVSFFFSFLMKIGNYFEKPALQQCKENMFHEISKKLQNEGFYVESLNYENPEFNEIYDKKYIPKVPFNENFEDKEAPMKLYSSGTIHKIIDLHGFSRLSASQALRRIFNCSDRKRVNIIKINVGRGLHSQKGQVLPNVVYEVARELNLPDPIQHNKNEGFMIMILPVKNEINDGNT